MATYNAGHLILFRQPSDVSFSLSYELGSCLASLWVSRCDFADENSRLEAKIFVAIDYHDLGLSPDLILSRVTPEMSSSCICGSR